MFRLALLCLSSQSYPLGPTHITLVFAAFSFGSFIVGPSFIARKQSPISKTSCRTSSGRQDF